jgi:ABC-type polysaccharide/polyol phosphate export permease
MPRSPSGGDYWHDLAEGLRMWRVWTHLALRDLRLEYANSRLGPLWATIGIGVLIAAKGFLFSLLMGAEIKIFILWLGSGLLVWLFIAGVINTGVSLFGQNRAQMLNIRLPFSFYVLKSVCKLGLNFLHHAPILIVLSFYSFGAMAPTVPWALVGLAICALTSVWVVYLLALLTTRWRTLIHLVPVVVPVLFMFTPIVWMTENLGDHQWIADLSPFFHYVQMVRAPLMGEWPEPLSWFVTCGGLVAGFGLVSVAHNAWRKTILTNA